MPHGPKLTFLYTFSRAKQIGLYLNRFMVLPLYITLPSLLQKSSSSPLMHADGTGNTVPIPVIDTTMHTYVNAQDSSSISSSISLQ